MRGFNQPKARALGNRIWPSLPPVAKDPSLQAGFGAAIQGYMDPCFGALPWIATSQTLPAMTKRGNDEKGKCDCPEPVPR